MPSRSLGEGWRTEVRGQAGVDVIHLFVARGAEDTIVLSPEREQPTKTLRKHTPAIAAVFKPAFVLWIVSRPMIEGVSSL